MGSHKVRSSDVAVSKSTKRRRGGGAPGAAAWPSPWVAGSGGRGHSLPSRGGTRAPGITATPPRMTPGIRHVDGVSLPDLLGGSRLLRTKPRQGRQEVAIVLLEGSKGCRQGSLIRAAGAKNTTIKNNSSSKRHQPDLGTGGGKRNGSFPRKQ